MTVLYCVDVSTAGVWVIPKKLATLDVPLLSIDFTAPGVVVAVTHFVLVTTVVPVPLFSFPLVFGESAVGVSDLGLFPLGFVPFLKTFFVY